MPDYPADWARSDLDGAIRALDAAGVVISGSHVGKGVRSIGFVLEGRVCRLVERTPKRRGEWLALDFPWPAAWPDIMLTAPGEPYDEDFADAAPPAGHALSSHDLPAARAVVDAGFAAASIDPPAELSIEAFDGALITTQPRIALNGATAAWLLNLARLALGVAPPIDQDDDVIGKILADSDDSSGFVRGTRAEVLHRLLWLLRIRQDEDGDTDGREPGDRLRPGLDRWIDEAARLAADRGSAGARAGVGDLVLRIADELHRSGIDADDSELAEQVLAVIAQID